MQYLSSIKLDELRLRRMTDSADRGPPAIENRPQPIYLNFHALCQIGLSASFSHRFGVIQCSCGDGGAFPTLR